MANEASTKNQIKTFFLDNKAFFFTYKTQGYKENLSYLQCQPLECHANHFVALTHAGIRNFSYEHVENIYLHELTRLYRIPVVYLDVTPMKSKSVTSNVSSKDVSISGYLAFL